ncbi:unnamed protein product [Musa acuminata subsp. burmannicoides]
MQLPGTESYEETRGDGAGVLQDEHTPLARWWPVQRQKAL